jgi:hypothetical protein
MAAMPPAPEDEGPHDAPAEGGPWSEAWSFDFATADGQLGGWIRYVRFADRAWYQAMLAGPNRQLLAVLDHEVPFRSSPFEVRTTGLWADHVCESPFDHWSLGLETFALGVDDPLELHGRQHGDRVALGFDLEWEAEGPILEHAHGYEQHCRVHGEVLVGAGVIDLDAVGARQHDWGPLDWWSPQGWRLTGTVEGGCTWSVDHRSGLTVARVVEPDGSVREEPASAELALDRHGMPCAALVQVDGEELRSEVLAITPVPLELGARRGSRPRALCRHRTSAGGVGVGWIELRDGSDGLPEP